MPFRRLSAKQAKAMELDKHLQRRIGCAELLEAFRTPPPTRLQRWLRRAR